MKRLFNPSHYTLSNDNSSQFMSNPSNNSLMLLYFSARWAGGCRFISLFVDEAVKQYGDRLQVFKVDVDSQPELTQRCRVQEVPTLILLAHGQIVDRVSGTISRPQFQRMLSESGQLSGSGSPTRVHAERSSQSVGDRELVQNVAQFRHRLEEISRRSHDSSHAVSPSTSPLLSQSHSS